jgi:hypothetical protein
MERAIQKEAVKRVEEREAKALPGGEESPVKVYFSEKVYSSIPLGQRKRPLLLRRGRRTVFFQEERLGGAGMQKIRTGSFPPPRSCMSFTLPSEPATTPGKLKEKKFIV